MTGGDGVHCTDLLTAASMGRSVGTIGTSTVQTNTTMDEVCNIYCDDLHAATFFAFRVLYVLPSPSRSVMTSAAVWLLHGEVIAYFVDEQMHDLVS